MIHYQAHEASPEIIEHLGEKFYRSITFHGVPENAEFKREYFRLIFDIFDEETFYKIPSSKDEANLIRTTATWEVSE